MINICFRKFDQDMDYKNNRTDQMKKLNNPILCCLFSLCCIASFGIPATNISQVTASTYVFAGRKTVTVTASSESAAFVEAQRKNPGWTAIKAKKIGNGKLWQVTMTK